MMIDVSKPPEYASTAFFTCCFMMILQKRNQYCLFRRQPVGSLPKDEGIVRFDDGIGDLQTAMRRQTMHKQTRLAGFRHEPFVDLIRPEHADSLLQFVLLTHAGPNIRVDPV